MGASGFLAASVQLRRHAGGPGPIQRWCTFRSIPIAPMFLPVVAGARSRSTRSSRSWRRPGGPPGVDENQRQPDPGDPSPRGHTGPWPKYFGALQSRRISRRGRARLRGHGAERSLTTSRPPIRGIAARATRPRPIHRAVTWGPPVRPPRHWDQSSLDWDHNWERVPVTAPGARRQRGRPRYIGGGFAWQLLRRATSPRRALVHGRPPGTRTLTSPSARAVNGAPNFRGTISSGSWGTLIIDCHGAKLGQGGAPPGISPWTKKPWAAYRRHVGDCRGVGDEHLRLRGARHAQRGVLRTGPTASRFSSGPAHGPDCVDLRASPGFRERGPSGTPDDGLQARSSSVNTSGPRTAPLPYSGANQSPPPTPSQAGRGRPPFGWGLTPPPI